jgi:hypothetical protein
MRIAASIVGSLRDGTHASGLLADMIFILDNYQPAKLMGLLHL